MYIVLTPYKSHQNGNVGARLVEQSAIELVKQVRNSKEINVHYRREDFTSRMNYLNSADAILIPNFHLTRNSRPKLYRICKNLSDVEPPIIPINGFYKFNPEKGEQIEEQQLDQGTTEFLNYIQQYCAEEIPARSDYVFEVLTQNGYNARMVGDPGWYDPEYIGSSFHRPIDIEQLVFTPPHDPFYTEQAKCILRRLGSEFGDETSKIISMHCAWDPLRDKEPNEELAEYGAKYGWKSRYTSHELSNIDFYEESDLHVGYLKHGHLAHLRQRIPSVVLAEDSRALGLIETLGTAGFPAVDYPRFNEQAAEHLKQVYDSTPVRGVKLLLEHLLPNDPLPEMIDLTTTAPESVADDVMEFINRQQSNGWVAYDNIASLFDKTYKEQMLPYLDDSLPK